MIDLNNTQRVMRFYRPKALNVRMRVYQMQTDAATLLPTKQLKQRFNMYFTRQGKLKEIIDTEPNLRQWVFSYNQSHRLTHKTLYSEEQVVLTEDHYAYNREDIMYYTRTIDYQEAEPVERHHLFMQPDEHVHELVIDPSQEVCGLYYTHHIENDATGREIKRLTYGNENEFINGFALFYNEAGQVKDRFNLNHQGKPVSHTSFEYNEHGDRELKVERSPKKKNTHQYNYTYDAMGYWNEMHHLKNGELKWIIERQIFFYNEGW